MNSLHYLEKLLRSEILSQPDYTGNTLKKTVKRVKLGKVFLPKNMTMANQKGQSKPSCLSNDLFPVNRQVMT